MHALDSLHRMLISHTELYLLAIKSATVVLLCYVAFTDLRTFKIENKSVFVLFVLYVLYVVVARTRHEVMADIFVGVAVFGFLLWVYTTGAVGGGDVKLLPVVCLWVGAHCAALFSILLLVLIGLHLIVVRLGWTSARSINGRLAIPYAPSVTGAMLGAVLLGCV